MRTRTALVAGSLCALVAVAVWQAGALHAPERATLDARFSIRGASDPPASIAIVALDADSIASLPEQLPLPRRYWAALIDRLRRDGARLIVFDIAFDAPTTDDPALRAAARRAAPVLFGTAEADRRTGNTVVLGGPRAQRAIGARVGSTLLARDPDGTVRRVPYAVNRLPTLAVVAAGLLGTHADRARFDGGGALIDAAGGSGSYPTVSLSQVLSGRVPAARFRGRTVLVGATAQALHDEHPTPLGSVPGVEIQANALRTVLAGEPLQATSDLWTLLAILVLAFAAPLAATRLSAGPALAVGAGALVAYLVIAQLGFSAGHVVNATAPLLAGVLAEGATLTLGYLGANRERHRLREQFAAFDPEVVDAVLDATVVGGLEPTGIIGGYRIESVAGRGGMAVVYRATQAALQRSVALKLIAPGYARDDEFRRRFLEESRLSAAVEHPNVIPIYEAGDDDGLLFIAMRFIDGLDLETVLAPARPTGAPRRRPDRRADRRRARRRPRRRSRASRRQALERPALRGSAARLPDRLRHRPGDRRGLGADARGHVHRLARLRVARADRRRRDRRARRRLRARRPALPRADRRGAVPAREPAGDAARPPRRAVPSVSDRVRGLGAFDAVVEHAMAKRPDDRPQTAAALAAEARAALSD